MQYQGLVQTPLERAVLTYPCAITKVFHDPELDHIVDICEQFGQKEKGKAGGNGEVTRRCQVSFITPKPEWQFIFDKLNHALAAVNAQHYGFILNGYDSIQYTVYGEWDKYDWHMDMSVGPTVETGMVQPRKLSATLLLNDNFEGGEFQMMTTNERHAKTIPMGRGDMVVFPSFMLHRVLPVVSGIRRSLVIWVTGPKFQ